MNNQHIVLNRPA